MANQGNGQNSNGQSQNGANKGQGGGQSRRRSGSRKRGGQKAKPVDLWRPVPPLPPVEPIVPASDPTALIRSLGVPPLRGRSDVAEAYLVTVAERVAGLATALAAAADLLATPDADD